MEAASTKDIAIKKLRQLPSDEVFKVLIFMAGLEAGITLSNRVTEETKSACDSV